MHNYLEGFSFISGGNEEPLAVIHIVRVSAQLQAKTPSAIPQFEWNIEVIIYVDALLRGSH